MPRKTKSDGEKIVIVTLRMPKALIAEIDEYAKGIEAKNPGLTVNRTNAANALITQALAASKKTSG